MVHSKFDALIHCLWPLEPKKKTHQNFFMSTSFCLIYLKSFATICSSISLPMKVEVVNHACQSMMEMQSVEMLKIMLKLNCSQYLLS